jgi:hypothetical protein
MRLPSTITPTVHARIASAPLVYVLVLVHVFVRVRVRVLVAGHTIASSALSDDSICLNALDIFLKSLFGLSSRKTHFRHYASGNEDAHAHGYEHEDEDVHEDALAFAEPLLQLHVATTAARVPARKPSEIADSPENLARRRYRAPDARSAR